MKKKHVVLILLLSLFWFDKAYASDYITSTGCGGYEVAIALGEKGKYTEVSCHGTLEEAQVVMNSNPSDDAFILKGNEVIDAKYALIDYDWSRNETIDMVGDNGVVTYFTTAGGLSDDAAYLGAVNENRIRIKLSGLTGYISKYEPNESTKKYEIIPLVWLSSPTYYKFNNGTVYHVFTYNVFGTGSSYSMSIGKNSISMPESDTKYYSYDGNYFYTDLKTMIYDYKVGNYNNAVNKNNPYYNYYQYLSFRSKTNYTVDNLNQYINSRTVDYAVLRNMGDALIKTQNSYNTNAAMILSVAMNESGAGKSPLAIDKHNVFGLGAVDSNPYGNGNSFDTVENCIDYFGFAYLSGKILQPGDWRFFGSQPGNKASGLAVKYASDPYWGEKEAHWYYDLDSFFGFQDYNTYMIGILNNNYSNTVYPKKSPNGLNVSSKFYQYKFMESSVTILGEEIVNGEKWYKIYSDPVLDGNLEYYSDDIYYNTNPKITNNYIPVYVQAKYFNVVSSGKVTPSPTPTPVDPDPVNPKPVDPEPVDPKPTPKSVINIVSDSGLKLNNTFIYGINPGESVELVKGKLTNAGGSVSITNQNGTEVSSGNIGTGFKITITSDTTITYTVVIYGDVNGDGLITAVDYVSVKNHIMGTSILSGANLESANVNRDGNISAVDYVNIKNYIMGTASINEN